MSSAASQAVIFELGKTQLVISKESAELGSAREEIPVTYTGEGMTIAFNPEFWLDVLKTMDANEVSIELSGMDRPAVIRQPGFTYVVLPMKVA
jgi:DNA polymerase-3 subunit beta